jgi:hypothetical protein
VRARLERDETSSSSPHHPHDTATKRVQRCSGAESAKRRSTANPFRFALCLHFSGFSHVAATLCHPGATRVKETIKWSQSSYPWFAGLLSAELPLDQLWTASLFLGTCFSFCSFCFACGLGKAAGRGVRCLSLWVPVQDHAPSTLRRLPCLEPITKYFVFLLCP